MTKEKKYSEKTQRLPIIFPIDLKSFAEGKAPKEIHVLPTGSWDHPAYGPIVITSEDITQFKANFDAEIRKAIPITEGHETFDEKPAVGWFKELIDKGEAGLFAVVEWNEKGKTLLKNREYKFFSPEFFSVYDDPESRVITKNVLVGGALTNKPYFKELKAVTMSEITNQFNFNDMELKDIVGKKVADLNDEEKGFLKDHKEDLNEEQLTEFGSVFESEGGDPPAEPPVEPATPPVESPAEPPVEPATPPAEPPVEPKNASELRPGQKVQVEASELQALKSMANRGNLAFEELRQNRIKEQAIALIFTEQHSEGRVLPKDEKKLFSFMLSLSATQRSTFAEIVGNIPKSNLFDEKGSGGAPADSATAELQTKVEAVRKNDEKMTYSDALTQVLADNKDLAKRYEEEEK